MAGIGLIELCQVCKLFPLRKINKFNSSFQRWSPLHSFSERGLFRTDRPSWSDEKGAKKRPRPADFKLPNEHWEWEREWHVDVNLKGQPTGIVSEIL